MKKAKSKIKTDKTEQTFKKEKAEEKAEISWQAPEFEYNQKNVSWYWLSLMITIILLALSLWQKNFLFAIFIIIAWLIIIYLSHRQATVWKFEINEKGIEIVLANGDPGSFKFYLYEEIEGFDIHPEISPAMPDAMIQPKTEEYEEYKELVLKVKKRFSPYLKINFPGINEEKIKKFLQEYIPKEEYSGSLADSISKLIGF